MLQGRDMLIILQDFDDCRPHAVLNRGSTIKDARSFNHTSYIFETPIDTQLEVKTNENAIQCRSIL